jgi:hypothetical protein
MSVLLIAKFPGDPDALKTAYDKADAELESKLGTRMPPGSLHHVSAVAPDGLYIVDVWESEESLRGMLQSPAFMETLKAAGFPGPDEADIQIVPIHAVLTTSNA